jgi:hypothetical protein
MPSAANSAIAARKDERTRIVGRASSATSTSCNQRGRTPTTFRWFAPRDLLETTTTDESYRALRTFFAEVKHHLSPGGRILVFFGTSGDLAYAHQLIRAAGLRAEVAAESRVTKEDHETTYYLPPDRRHERSSPSRCYLRAGEVPTGD